MTFEIFPILEVVGRVLHNPPTPPSQQPMRVVLLHSVGFVQSFFPSTFYVKYSYVYLTHFLSNFVAYDFSASSEAPTVCDRTNKEWRKSRSFGLFLLLHGFYWSVSHISRYIESGLPYHLKNFWKEIPTVNQKEDIFWY